MVSGDNEGLLSIKTMKYLLLILCLQPLLAFSQEVKVVSHNSDNQECTYIYKNDTLYAFTNAKADTTFISDEYLWRVQQNILRDQNKLLEEEGIYLRYPNIVDITIERIASLLERKSKLNYKQTTKKRQKIIKFYNPTRWQIPYTYLVAIKECELVIENNKLTKEFCSYYENKRVGLPETYTKFEFIYDEKGRIVKIFNKGKLEQTISYIEQ